MKTSTSIMIVALLSTLLATNALGRRQLAGQPEPQQQGFGFAFPFSFPFPAQPPATQGGKNEGGFKLPFQFPIPINPSPKPNPNGFPQLNEEQQKCLQSFHDKGMETCLQDLGNSFQTQRVNVGPQCCAALEGVDEACKPVIHFQNPMFQIIVQQHCAGGASADAGSGSGVASGPGLSVGFEKGSA